MSDIREHVQKPSAVPHKREDAKEGKLAQVFGNVGLDATMYGISPPLGRRL